MTVALGASAYSVAVFHLMTHAFFKALLFLGAGSVIIGMHHDQDIRNMGGLRKYMPITWITSLLGSLALIGTPFFAGFYSKDSIIEAVGASHLPGAAFAHAAVLIGVFVTAFYSFRMYFLVFHGPEHFHHKPFPGEHDAPHGDDDAHAHDSGAAHGAVAAHHDDHAHDHGDSHGHAPHESPWVVTAPLILLAIPSVVVGYLAIDSLLYGGFFGSAIAVNAELHPAMEELAREFHGPLAMGLGAWQNLPFWLALAGVVSSYAFYILKPEIPARIGAALSPLVRVLENKYYLDWFNEHVLAKGARLLGGAFWKGGDMAFIDGALVNGSAGVVAGMSRAIRQIQTGYLSWYALVMVLGVFGLMTWQLWPYLLSLMGH
jgi:NADH-quinone oxidoreductase subunit L